VPAGLILEIDIGKLLSVVVARMTKQASCSSTVHGGGKRRPFIAV